MGGAGPASVRETFGLDKALDISADRIAAHIATRLAAGKRPGTVNRELAALRRMFSLAVRAGKLASRPPITLLAEDNVREGFIDPPEFARLLDALRAREAPEIADAAEFGYLTCLRRGNALGAAWTWFTLRIEDGAVIGDSVRLPGAVTKNKKPLPLVLTGQPLELVARRWALRVAECPYVFHRNGRVIRDFRATCAAACEAVGLPRLLFHDLRRSGARSYRRAGVTEDVIQRIGSWKTKSMLARYNVLDERDLAEAGERLAGSSPTRPARNRRWYRSARPGGACSQKLRGQNTDISADSALAPPSGVAVSS